MMADAALVTGYPNFVVRRLVARLVADDVPVFVLCKEDFEDDARREFHRHGDGVKVVTGDVTSMHLGLSGKEVRELEASVRWVYHLAGIYYLGADEAEMELVNVEGTRNVLACCEDLPRLERFIHYSTAFVSGHREGVIMEDELAEPPRFRNAFERTKFVAEGIVREAGKTLPVTIVRPALIVGDSTTGEIDRMDGPHFFMYVLVNTPLDVHLPYIGRGDYPLNIVPVDYVVDAMAYLGRLADSAGKTYHLVDQNPLSSRTVFQLICALADKKPPRRSIPSNLATALMKMPGLEKAWRSPRLFVEMLNQLVLYNAINTSEALAGTGIDCPSFPSYARNLVAFLKQKHQR
jgi:nucleoside-diphosphate-sugar epimerase